MKRHPKVPADVVNGRFRVDLSSRRIVEIALPEFLICALQARLREVNTGAQPHELCSLDSLIESELANLVSVRDVAELEISMPGFAQAVHRWLSEL
jgi:hypothetical protein